MTASRKSGVKGIYWDRSVSKWEVKLQGKRIGRYKTIDEAIFAKENFVESIENKDVSLMYALNEIEILKNKVSALESRSLLYFAAKAISFVRLYVFTSLGFKFSQQAKKWVE